LKVVPQQLLFGLLVIIWGEMMMGHPKACSSAVAKVGGEVPGNQTADQFIHCQRHHVSHTRVSHIAFFTAKQILSTNSS